MFTVARLNVEAGASIGGALSGLRTLSRAVGAFGGFLGGIAQTALGVLGGQALFAGLSAGFRSTIGSAIGLNATLENNTVAFSTLLGSAAAAQTFLGELRKFAAETPFEFVGLADTAKIMLGMGFTAQQIIPLLTDIGNVASGLTLGAAGAQHLGIVLGQMHTSGRVLGQDLLQLQQMGINTSDIFTIMAQTLRTNSDLQKQLKIDPSGLNDQQIIAKLRAMQSAGKLPSDFFITAFQAFAKAKFPNMLAAQAKTFTGIWENVKENLHNAFGDIFAPLFEMLKRVGQAILDFEATATFAQWVTQAQGWIGTITTVLGAFASTWRNIKESTNLGVLQSGLVALELTLRSTFGPEVAGWFHNALTFFQVDLPMAWTTLQGVWDTLKPKLDELIGWLTTALPEAGVKTTAAWKEIQTAVTPVVPVLERMATALGTMAKPETIKALQVDLPAAIAAISTAIAVLELPKLVAMTATFFSMAAASAPLVLLSLALGALVFMLVRFGPAFQEQFTSIFATIGGNTTNLIQKILLLADVMSLLSPVKMAQVMATGGIGKFLTEETARITSLPFTQGQQTEGLNTALAPKPLTPGETGVLGEIGSLAGLLAGLLPQTNVDNSRTVTINNPVIRKDEDVTALTVATQAALGQQSAAAVAPADFVGAS